MNYGRRIPELYVEKDALGELPLDLDPAIREHLQADPDRSARLAELRASDEEILAQYPPQETIARIQKRLRETGKGTGRRLALRFALAAVLVLVAAAGVLVLVALPEDPGETILVKGDPGLAIHRRTAGAPEPLEPGDRVRAGDLLQISYLPKGAAHGVILSADGRGNVNLHFPPDASLPTRLERNDRVSLPFSYELDDAPGFERFFFITSAFAIPVDQVVRWAGMLGADPGRQLPLPPWLSKREFLLKKPAKETP